MTGFARGHIPLWLVKGMAKVAKEQGHRDVTREVMLEADVSTDGKKVIPIIRFDWSKREMKS